MILVGSDTHSKGATPTGSVVVYVYNQFYSSQRLGYGSAVAFLLFAVILGLTMVQLSVSRRRGAVLRRRPRWRRPQRQHPGHRCGQQKWSI